MVECVRACVVRKRIVWLKSEIQKIPWPRPGDSRQKP